MIKIMFVCHGNICRSPMAEFIFRDLASKMNASHRVSASSSATSTEEIWNGRGNPVYPPVKRVLAEHGISCDGKTAVQLKKSDYGKYDMFIAMDDLNVRNIIRIFGSDPQGKVFRLLDFTSHPGEVSDPWFTRQFDVTYNVILEGCSALLKKLLDE